MKLYIFRLAEYLMMYRHDLYSELQADMEELQAPNEHEHADTRIAKIEECLRLVDALLELVKLEIMEVMN